MVHLNDKEFYELTNYIKSNFGINLTNKKTLIEGRLSNLLREMKISNFNEYMKIVMSDKSGAHLNKLLNKLTTNHTYFLREKEHFDFLTSTILPEFQQNNPSRKDIRIWSAACSSGQEPYTMAMAIDEYFGSIKPQWDTTILATDISMDMLSKCKAGMYPEEAIADVPDNWKKKYFVDRKNGYFQVCDRIRKEIVIKPFNLMDDFNFRRPFDIIFCRNVMIYFDTVTKENLINKFYDNTSRNGYLCIGHAEVINKERTKYKFLKPAIYKREE